MALCLKFDLKRLQVIDQHNLETGCGTSDPQKLKVLLLNAQGYRNDQFRIQ